MRAWFERLQLLHSVATITLWALLTAPDQVCVTLETLAVFGGQLLVGLLGALVLGLPFDFLHKFLHLPG